MPTYVPKTPDITKFMKGPGDLYVGVALPADGALLAIGANGKLDVSVHTTALAVASTDKGVKFTAKPELEAEKIDEVRGDLNREIMRWNMSLSGAMREILRHDLIAAMTPGVTRATDLVATPNTSRLKFGLGSPTLPCIAHIAKIPSSPTSSPLFEVVVMYKAFNDAGIDDEINSEKGVARPFNFIAEPVVGALG
jgi:hypothetical protein